MNAEPFREYDPAAHLVFTRARSPMLSHVLRPAISLTLIGANVNAFDCLGHTTTHLSPHMRVGRGAAVCGFVS